MTRRKLELGQPLVLQGYSSDTEMSFGLERVSGQIMSGLGAKPLVPRQNKDMATAMRKAGEKPKSIMLTLIYDAVSRHRSERHE